LTLSTSAQSIWADANSWSVTNPLSGSTSSERWYTPQSTSGIFSSSTTYAITYYNQYYINFTYTTNPKTNIPSPSLTFTEFGGNKSVSVPFSPSVVAEWVDGNTRWTATNPLTYNNEQWYPDPPSGTASSSTTVTITYTPGVTFTLNYVLYDTTLNTAPTFTFYNASNGKLTTVTLSTTPTTYLVEAGTPWSVSIANPSQTQQFFSPQALSGTATASLSQTFQFYLDDYVYVQYNTYGGSVTLSVNYTHMGATQTLTETAALSPQGIWVDNGTTIVPTAPVVAIFNYERYAMPPTQRPGYTVMGGGGMYTFDYYHQFAFVFTVSLSGEPYNSYPSVNVTQYGATAAVQLGSNPVVAWADAGSTWAAPNPFFSNLNEFYAQTPVRGIVASSYVSQPVFQLQYLANPAPLPATPQAQMAAGDVIPATVGVYTSLMGPYALALIFGAAAVALYLKTENSLLSLLITALGVAISYFLLPSPVWLLIEALLAVAIAGTLYKTLTRRTY
jgi:hypothetical protein